MELLSNVPFLQLLLGAVLIASLAYGILVTAYRDDQLTHPKHWDDDDL